MITNCVVTVNESKNIRPYSLSHLKMRETLFPCFLYDVSTGMIMGYRSCPVMAHLFFRQKAKFQAPAYPACGMHPVFSGLYPKSFPSGLASPGSFLMPRLSPNTLFTGLSAKQPTRLFGPAPGTERK